MQGGANSIANGRDNKGEKIAPVFLPKGDPLLIEDAPELVSWGERSLSVGDKEFVSVGDLVVVAVVEAVDSARFFLGAKPIRRFSRSNTA